METPLEGFKNVVECATTKLKRKNKLLLFSGEKVGHVFFFFLRPNYSYQY